MADYLPPVVARLSMDMGDFLAGIAKAKAELKSLNGTMNIRTDGIAAAVAKMEALKKSAGDMRATLRVTTDSMGNLVRETVTLGTAGAAADKRWRILGTGIRLAGNGLHWLISGLAEFAAVAVPAIVALAAGMAVMAPAAINAAQHMRALAVATQASQQMFGQTIGSVLGFSGALQNAQAAARPAVFGILGSALITAKEGMGGFSAAGLQVTQMLQAFGAKVALDFGPGGALSGGHLFKNMTTDLQGLGQVLGNIGHAFFSFANAMPGLAEVLLRGLVGITGFVAKLASMGAPLITAVMGFEEFSRWGGLAVNTLNRLGLASSKVTGGTFSLARIASVFKGLASIAPTALANLGALFARLGATDAGVGLTKAAMALRGAIAGLSTAGTLGIAALAAGIGFLIYKAVTAKSAIQQMGDAMQKAVLGTSNTAAMGVAAANIGKLNQGLNTTSRAATAAAVGATGYVASVQQVARASAHAAVQAAQTGAAIKQQAQDMRNVAEGAQLIARTYGTTFVGALALADEANVKLANGITGTSQAAMVARMQIASLVQGYQAMGQSSGQVGADMTALAIQSGLAATGVSKLNSAWDDFTSNLTGGTGALANLGTDLTSLSTGVTKITNVLGKAGSVSLSVKSFADSLKSFSGAGATAWTNFNKAISSGQGMLDWMRTAGAEGALSAKQFKQAGLDMASAFVPLAAQSKTAQAELMGLVQQIDPSIQTFSQLKSAISQSGASFGGLGGIVSGATQKMAMMNSVAQTLGTVLNSALVSALQGAQVAASGSAAAMQKYVQDLMDGNRAAASADYSNLIGDLEKLGLSAQQAAALIAQVTANLNAMPSSKTVTVYTNFVTTGAGASAGINPGAAGLPRVGHAKGTPSAPSGWAWVGEAGPELVKFRGGEQVLPNQVSMGFANGTGGPYGAEFHIYLDGRELNAAISQRAIQTQRRTGTNQMQKRTR